MKVKVGDVIEDRRYLPTLHIVIVVNDVTGEYVSGAALKTGKTGQLLALDADYVVNTKQAEIVLLTPQCSEHVRSAGPMADTVTMVLQQKGQA